MKGGCIMPEYVKPGNDKYIKLSQALKAIDDNACWYAHESMERIPAADVRENVHGRWIGVPVTQPYIKCSVCGHSCHAKTSLGSFGGMQVDVYNYCPNCGAQMSK